MHLRSVGITGGIGSGKTTICRIFETMGYEVYYADERAKWLMQHNPDLRREIILLLGEEAYDGTMLNRAWIASKVFKEQALLSDLNGIVHPATKKDFEQWVEQKKIDDTYTKPFVLKEAAILFESGGYKGLDAVINVYAPKTLRLKRVMSRDGVDEAKVLERMDKQWPDLLKIQKADITIYNDGAHLLIPQVRTTIEQLA